MLEGDCFTQDVQPPDGAARAAPRPASARWLATLGAAVLALSAAACSRGSSEDEGATPRGRPAPALVTTTVVTGGSQRENAILRRVADGLERTTLRRIAIGPADTRRETADGKAIALRFTTVAGATARRQWDEWIVAGAYSRRLLAAGLPAIVDGADADGGFTSRPRVDGQPDPQPLSAEREAELVKAVRDAAAAAGARVVRLDVGRPYAPAVALSVAPTDPASFLKNRLRPLLQELDAQRPRLEGLYVAVLDEEGRLALEFGSWTRNPAGSYWVRRDLANCSPIRQSDPPGTEPPPPCPV